MEPLHVFGAPLRLKRASPLPPFPTPEELRVPVVPPAGPFLGDVLDAAKTLWKTGIYRLQGIMPTPPVHMQEAARVCILQLEALEIPPAEWLLCRLNAFAVAEVPGRLSHAPFGFVFSPKALSRELEGPMSWAGRLASPRVVHTAATQKAVEAWHKMRRSGTSDEYLAALHHAQQENLRVTEEILQEHKAGVYVW